MAFVKDDDVYQELVKHIQDYAFNNTTICKSIESRIRENYNEKKTKISQNKIEDLNKNFIFPCENDSLFFMKKINDISLINIQKYNLIKFILLDAFDELTIQESKIYKNIFESFEEKIYYNTLHTELEFLGIKNFAIKELMKIELDAKLKTRILDKIKSVKPMPDRFLKKKIDVDLTGYGIYINAFIGQSL